MELFIVRHGKTIWNAKNKLQGQTDIELNEDGERSAAELGDMLSHTTIDLIYSSPLKRAIKTAQLISGQRNIPIITDERLKEISFGDKEGTTTAEWFSDDSPYRFFFDKPELYKTPPNGESFESVLQRTKEFIQAEIEPKYHDCERIMIVAHGALNKGLMSYIQNHDLANYWGKGLQNNCEVSIFSYDGKKWETVKE